MRKQTKMYCIDDNAYPTEECLKDMIVQLDQLTDTKRYPLHCRFRYWFRKRFQHTRIIKRFIHFKPGERIDGSQLITFSTKWHTEDIFEETE